MQDKSKHFLTFVRPLAPAPGWRNALGASLLAVGMAALWSTPTFAQGTPLSGVAAPVMVVNQQVAASAASGIVIIAVDEGGPAAKAGIVRGDILLLASDVSIDSSTALYNVVLAAKVGDELELVVQHGDETRTIPVTLGQLGGRAYLGVQVVDSANTALPVPVPNLEIAPAIIDPEVTATATISTDVVTFAPGLAIAEVMAGSPAATAGLEAGDLIVAIDGQPVASIDDILNHLKGHTPGEVMQLTVQKGGVAGAAIVELAVTLGAAPGDPGRAYLGIQVVTPPASVTIEAEPPTAFTAPALPVAPGMPPMPGVAPYYGYPGASASAGGACGTTIINQYFYGPTAGATFSAPLPPPVSAVPAMPAMPADPNFIYYSGVNPEAYPGGVSVQAGPGTFEKKVIIAGKATAAPGMEAQSFMVQAQPAMPSGQAGDVVYFWRALPDGQASADVYRYPAQPGVAGGQEVIVKGVVQEGIPQKDVIVYRTQSPQVVWSAPVEETAPGGNVIIYKVVTGEEAGQEVSKEVKRFNVQVLPEGGTMQVVPLDPSTGVAVPSAVPVIPQDVPYDVATPVGGDGWY